MLRQGRDGLKAARSVQCPLWCGSSPQAVAPVWPISSKGVWGMWSMAAEAREAGFVGRRVSLRAAADDWNLPTFGYPNEGDTETPKSS